MSVLENHPMLRCLFGATLALAASTAFAAPVAKPVPAAETVQLPLDLLQERLFKAHKSKRAKSLKDAYEALLRDRHDDAAALATGATHDPLFADYGYWIAASANRERGTKANKVKVFEEAARYAQKAISLFGQIESTSPYSPFLKSLPREIGRAELALGDARWGAKKWVQAQSAYERGFQRLFASNSQNQIHLENLSHYAEACAKKPSELCSGWMQKFSLAYVKTSEEIKAIAKYQPSILDKVKASYGPGKSTVPYKAPDLDLVAFESAMKLYFDEKWSQATKSFRQFLDDFPRSAHRYRARYWLAQALSHQQEHEKAHKMYAELQKDSPLSYYGLLSSLMIGRRLDSTIDVTLPLAQETDPGLQPFEIIRLKRAKHFIAEKAYGLAAIELRDIRPRDGLTSTFLMYLAMLNARASNYTTSFTLLSDLIQRNSESVFSSYGLRMIFPIVYYELIKKYAAENQLDPILVISLIKQESAFDHDATSWVGASGLMQLMPFTAVETMPEITTAELIQPEKNIKVGTRYLKKVLTQFNGNIVLALAGYNAGPNAAARWLRDTPPKRGIQEFIESIPYRETRDYVSSIIRNYYWYSLKLTGDTPKSLGYFWNSQQPEPVMQPIGTAQAPSPGDAIYGPVPPSADGAGNGPASASQP